LYPGGKGGRGLERPTRIWNIRTTAKTTRTTTAMDATAMDAKAAAAISTTAEGTTRAESTGAAVTTTVVAVAAREDSACGARQKREVGCYLQREAGSRGQSTRWQAGSGADQPAMHRDSVA
jgi:hypothetical protein